MLTANKAILLGIISFALVIICPLGYLRMQVLTKLHPLASSEYLMVPCEEISLASNVEYMEIPQLTRMLLMSGKLYKDERFSVDLQRIVNCNSFDIVEDAFKIHLISVNSINQSSILHPLKTNKDLELLTKRSKEFPMGRATVFRSESGKIIAISWDYMDFVTENSYYNLWQAVNSGTLIKIGGTIVDMKVHDKEVVNDRHMLLIASIVRQLSNGWERN